MGMASFCNDLAMPGLGRLHGRRREVRRHAIGHMNMMGNLAGYASPVVIGHILAATGRNWDLTFFISGAIYIIGSIAWLFIDPVTPIQSSSEAVSSH